ncbi:MAG: HK97 family phage prohead protease [Patescibacteria group bacterium]|nr:HK97 family phage prohead protease [Patescibacteria group bacterium]
MSNFSLNIPITKVDEEQRIVYGYATVEELDRQGDIVDYEASKEAFGAWAGNIREQHDNKRTVGKNVHLEFDDDNKRVLIGAYVSKSTDGENAWTKVKEGILTGFSIGARVVKSIRETVKSGDMDVVANRIMGYTLHEVSLVDVPACPSAQFVMVKSADGQLTQVEEMHESITEPWYFKSFMISPAQLNQKAVISDTTNMSKKSKETVMSDEISKATAVLGEDARDHNAEVVAPEVGGVDAEVVETPAPKAKKVEKATAVLGEDARDENAEVVEAEVGGVEPVEEVEAPKEVKKGLYNVAQLAECLENLTWIAESAEFEAMYEGDKSAVPAKLRAAVAQVGAVLSEMVVEEVAEAAAESAVTAVELADTPEVTKAATEPSVTNDDLLKSLTAAVSDKVAELITPLKDRLDVMESRSVSNAPVKQFTVVDKVADASQAPDEAAQLLQKSDDMLANPDKYTQNDRNNLMVELLKQRRP